ncbi:N-formylglutamate amidohydrolase [Breoghania sp.]|uniref:N-formylglutamate amidohydrolase n=1 Tax=Breoghania sp. TaxID=2065378 RepID=UPI002627455A|nr:N-formylglutamate amidohydrolase [Breoghania sp.]MDJ0932448.1 N-formylglutamate amidohydrolase [Breoghania sp.]
MRRATFSRLLIDPNRGEDDPTIVMRISDGALIPDNAYIDAVERDRRIARFYQPYHAAIAAMLQRMEESGHVPAIVPVHSFTPVWRDWPRPWHVGLLWDKDPHLPVPLMDALKRDPRSSWATTSPISALSRTTPCTSTVPRLALSMR